MSVLRKKLHYQILFGVTFRCITLKVIFTSKALILPPRCVQLTGCLLKTTRYRRERLLPGILVSATVSLFFPLPPALQLQVPLNTIALNTNACSHRHLTETGQCLKEIKPSTAGHTWVPNSTAQTALQRKTATLNWRYTFCTGLVRDDAQLLCSLLVRKHIYSSPKVRTGRLVTRSTRSVEFPQVMLM